MGAENAVAEAGRLFGGECILQRPKFGRTHGRPALMFRRYGTCVASEAEMLATSCANDGGRPSSWPISRSDAACSARSSAAKRSSIEVGSGAGAAPWGSGVFWTRRDLSSSRCSVCSRASFVRPVTRTVCRYVACDPTVILRIFRAAAYLATICSSAAIAARRNLMSAGGGGGVPSTWTPLHAVSASGRTPADAASTILLLGAGLSPAVTALILPTPVGGYRCSTPCPG